MTCSFLPAIGMFMSKRHYRHRKTSRNTVGLIMLIVFSGMLGSMYHRSYSFGIFCTSCFILIDVLRCLDPFCPATWPATHMCFVFVVQHSLWPRSSMYWLNLIYCLFNYLLGSIGNTVLLDNYFHSFSATLLRRQAVSHTSWHQCALAGLCA